MIIVKLMGGLGNQMFQYAAGLSLARRHSTPLKLDLSFLNADAQGAYTQRSYELGVFGIENCFASEEDVAPFVQKGKSRIARSANRLVPFLFRRLYAAERGHNYMPAFEKFPKDTYLDGFWQSEKYFARIADIIRNEFQFSAPLAGKNLDLAEQIKKKNAVSLHVRRGDYVKNKEVLSFHGLCSPEYYAQGVNYILSRQSGCELYIFSDDSEWCRQHLVFDLPCTYIDHNKGAQSFEDMRLMSLCKHHLIANSSFSWWGAWLNPSEEKIVVAPKTWFAKPGEQADDIYPDKWVKL